MRCPAECNMAKPEKKKTAHKARAFKYKALVEEVDDEENEEQAFFEEESRLLRKLESDKTQLAPIQEELDLRHIYEMIDHRIQSLEKKSEKTAVELVPPQYHVYLDVFEKKALECMPLRKPWDHAIYLVPNFKPIKFHIYSCSPMKQEEIDAFIDDQLAKGYICPSMSDQTSGVFFIPKKNEKKQMVQDYQYINSKTLKNNYLLPLISDLVDKIGNAKLFTKWIFDGATTMSESEKVMKERHHLFVIEVLTNHWSCSLAYATLLPRFKL